MNERKCPHCGGVLGYQDPWSTLTEAQARAMREVFADGNVYSVGCGGMRPRVSPLTAQALCRRGYLTRCTLKSSRAYKLSEKGRLLVEEHRG